MVRLFNVYYPKRTLVLIATESILVLLALLVPMAVEFGSDTPLVFGYETGFFRISVAAAIFTCCVYYVDLYGATVLASPRKTRARIFASVGASCIILAAVYALAPAIRPGEYEIVPGILQAAMAVFASRSAFHSLSRSPRLAQRAVLLPAKFKSLDELDYPADLMEVVVASDGSTDATNATLQSWQGPRQKAIILEKNQGKAAALNHAVGAATGEILVFTDARQRISPDAARVLTGNFADPEIGCVSGELILEDAKRGAAAGGLGLYWEVEKWIRRWESDSGSVVGVTGALYAARRDLVPALPAGTILDDVFIPLQAARMGKRIVFDGRALSYDRLADDRREFWRKVRTLSGNYQLLRLSPWLLATNNGIRFRFICHKLLRLLIPFALLGILISTLFLAEPFYRAVLLGLAAILSALHVRAGLISRLGSICSAFLVLNAAAALAFFYFVTGRRVAWTR